MNKLLTFKFMKTFITKNKMKQIKIKSLPTF